GLRAGHARGRSGTAVGVRGTARLQDRNLQGSHLRCDHPSQGPALDGPPQTPVCRDDEGRSRKNNFIWSHHLMVFVLDDVTMPDEKTRCCITKINHYPRDLARRGEYSILEPGFVTH